MALALLLVVACTQTPEPDDPAESSAYRLDGECPGVEVVPDLTVDDLNAYLNDTDLPAWEAADIGASARLSDDRLVWVFGDTVRSPTFDVRMVSNSMLVSSGPCVAQVMTVDDGAVIPDEQGDSDVIHWPMSVVAVEAPVDAYDDESLTDVLMVLTARTRRGGTGNEGAWDYTFLGTSAAIFTVGADRVPTLAEVVEISPDSEDYEQINWGAASTLSGDWIYVYGTRALEGRFGRELYVSRIAAADPRDRTRWRVWDGSDWVEDDPADTPAAPILGSDGGVSQTLSVHEKDGMFIAVSKRDGDFGDFVSVWSSPSPTGPWTLGDQVSAPTDIDAGVLQYAPLAHPDIALANGRLLVSVSRNTTDFQRLLDDPEATGRPVFTEVEAP